LIPFTVQIPENERDPNLLAKLKNELPGVLAWAVRGWQRYQADGLQPPAAVATATIEYRNESDIIGTFLDERCVLGASMIVRGQQLYDAYSEWSKAGNLRPLTNPRFARALNERNYENERDRRGMFWCGIGLMETTQSNNS